MPEPRDGSSSILPIFSNENTNHLAASPASQQPEFIADLHLSENTYLHVIPC